MTTTPVFVSHSWGDKTFVDKLVNDLEGVADFWYDSRETKPGERIDQDVSQGIKTCDMMLLVWSVNASRSQWVPLELDQATSLGKHIIPVVLDTTPLPDAHKLLLGIDATDWRDNYAKCFMRINLAFLTQHAKALGDMGVNIDIDRILPDLNDHDAVINYVNDYRNQQNIEGDGGYWINRVLESTNNAFAKGSEWMASLQGDMDFTQDLVGRIDVAKNDPGVLLGLREEIRQKEKDSSAVMENLGLMVDQMLATFPEQVHQQRIEQEDEPEKPPFESKQGRKIRRQIREAMSLERETGILAEQLRIILAGMGIAPNAETIEEAKQHIIDYIRHVPEFLDSVVISAGEHGWSDEVKPLVKVISKYFNKGDDLIDDSLGLYGLLDDAYLAFAIVQCLNERALEEFGSSLVDDDFNGANQWVEALLQPDIVTVLKQKAQQAVDSEFGVDTWKVLGGIALGGIAAYGLYKLISGQDSYTDQNPTPTNNSWGNTFEDQVSQFMAENGYSTPDW
ncbi:MAG: toll/interleukin-1 receptor domain-containing protein [Candidatus Thiodiazotropha sp. (ex. Lucinoma kazani)]